MAGTKTPNDTDPGAQISAIINSVTSMFQNASGKTAEGSRLITHKVMQQSEANTRKMFETLQSMSKTTNPTEIATIYTDFVRGSAKMHADQLAEIGQIMMRTNKDAWEPVANAIKLAAMKVAQK